MPGSEARIIDGGVRNDPLTQADLVPYLDERWRGFLEASAPGPAPSLTVDSGLAMPARRFAAESYEGDARPGTNRDAVAKRVFEVDGAERAILSFDDVRSVTNLANPYLAAAAARAANDWLVHEWLDQDDRFSGSILIASQIPELAEAEIRRLGADPRFAQVLIANNPVGKPLGHPVYHSIYRAAEEMGLPVCLPAMGAGGIAPSPIGGGYPNFAMEYYTMQMHGSMTHLLSFITQGVFQLFPGLKLILAEVGQAWVAPMAWRFDLDYKGIRREIPWVDRLPSEYVRDHVRLTTGPLDLPPDPEQLIQSVEAIGGADMLLYTSNYPHWDANDPNVVAERLPAAWRAKVLGENALATYRLPAATPAMAS